MSYSREKVFVPVSGYNELECHEHAIIWIRYNYIRTWPAAIENWAESVNRCGYAWDIYDTKAEKLIKFDTIKKYFKYLLKDGVRCL